MGASEKLYDEMSRDHLTGLLNLRGLESELDRLSVSMAGEFAICFVDLDNLKTVNDTEGHEAGNQLIKKAAEILAESVRTDDGQITPDRLNVPSRQADIVSAARIGGDEFVLLLVSVNSQPKLDVVLGRIRNKLDNGGVQAALDGALHRPGMGRDELLDLADGNMAADKAARKQAQFEALPKRKRVAALLGERMMRYAGINPPRQ